MSLTTDLAWKTVIPDVAVKNRKGYFLLPAFAPVSDVTWRGASEVVKQFNYSATENFTLARCPVKPAQGILPGGVGYVLCIKYRVGETVFRYKLWEDVGEVLNVPLYAGEVIKKNFCLEVWTCRDLLEVYQERDLKLRTLVYEPVLSVGDIAEFELCVGEDAGDLTAQVSGGEDEIPDDAAYEGGDPATYDLVLEAGVAYRWYPGLNEFSLIYDRDGDAITINVEDVDGHVDFTTIGTSAQLLCNDFGVTGNGKPVTGRLIKVSDDAELPLDLSASAWLDNDESSSDEVEDTEVDLGLGDIIYDASGEPLTDAQGNPLRSS